MTKSRIERPIALSGLTAMMSTGAWAPSSTADRYSVEKSVTGRNGKTATYEGNGLWGNGAHPNFRSAMKRSNGQVTSDLTGPDGHLRTLSDRTGGRQ